jgi:hypothetical protein
MQGRTACAVRAKAPIRTETQWGAADDHALVNGMLANDDGAWLEFLGRFDEQLTQCIGSTIDGWSRMLRTRDLVEAVKNDVHAYLTRGDMRPLRAFDLQHGTLAAWLSRLAQAHAIRRLQLLTSIVDDDVSGFGDGE